MVEVKYGDTWNTLLKMYSAASISDFDESRSWLGQTGETHYLIVLLEKELGSYVVINFWRIVFQTFSSWIRLLIMVKEIIDFRPSNILATFGSINFLKTVFYKFYLIHSRIPWPICCSEVFLKNLALKISEGFSLKYLWQSSVYFSKYFQKPFFWIAFGDYFLIGYWWYLKLEQSCIWDLVKHVENLLSWTIFASS